MFSKARVVMSFNLLIMALILSVASASGALRSRYLKQHHTVEESGDVAAPTLDEAARKLNKGDGRYESLSADNHNDITAGDNFGDKDEIIQDGNFLSRLLHGQVRQHENYAAARCGYSWEAATYYCGHKCPFGQDAECPSGQYCFSDVYCDDGSTAVHTFFPTAAPTPFPSAAPTPFPTAAPTFFPTAAPTTAVLTFAPTTAVPTAAANRCGYSWEHATYSCGKTCPFGQDAECPYDQTCFSDVTCKKEYRHLVEREK
jgi:hypothetical protein